MQKIYSFCNLTKFPISAGSGPEKWFPSRLLQFPEVVSNSLANLGISVIPVMMPLWSSCKLKVILKFTKYMVWIWIFLYMDASTDWYIALHRFIQLNLSLILHACRVVIPFSLNSLKFCRTKFYIVQSSEHIIATLTSSRKNVSRNIVRRDSTYRFDRVVMLVSAFGNGPDNRFPIKELQNKSSRYIIMWCDVIQEGNTTILVTWCIQASQVHRRPCQGNCAI